MPKAGALCDRDFVLWSEEQAALLRQAKDSNLPLDWENRAEIVQILRDSPSLRREIEVTIADQIGTAAKLAEVDLSRHGEAIEKMRVRIERGGFTAEEVLGDWFPD